MAEFTDITDIVVDFTDSLTLDEIDTTDEFGDLIVLTWENNYVWDGDQTWLGLLEVPGLGTVPVVDFTDQIDIT